MFDGMPEQFYQFLAAATTTSIPTSSSNILTNTTNNTNTAAAAAAALSIPLSFSLHHHQHQHRHAAGFPTYTQQTPPPPPPPAPQPTFDVPYGHLLHHHHHHHSQFLTRNEVVKDETLQLDPTRLQDGSETQRSSSSSSSLMLLPEIPWSNDEMLALFRIRSSMDNTWFPDFIWENVSRKLSEIGFKRSAEKCKEKFEEETRSFNSSIISNNTCNNKNNNNNNIPSNNNYRLFGELEELCNNNNTNNINVDDHDDGDGGDDHGKGSLPDQCERDHTLETCLSQGDVCVDDGKEEEEKDDERPEIEDGMLEGDDDETREDNDKSNDNDNDNDLVEDEQQQSVDDSEKTEESTKRVMKKRKRQKKFEMFKGFCEKIVSKMMAQQEELHCKIIRDMVKRDEEKIAKEEAWKRQEFERLEKELEARAHEQAVSGDRQTKILGFLKKFSTSSSSFLESQSFKEALEKLNKVPKMTSSNSSILTQDSISVQLQPTSSCTTHTPLVNNIPSSSSNENPALDNSKSTLPLKSSSLDHQNPNNPPPSHPNESLKIPSLVSSHKFSRSDHTSTNAADHITNNKALENTQSGGLKFVVGNNNGNKDDTGRRWPRDEVLALINIRCSLFNNNGGETHHDTETYSKGPLWERISQKMTELGYKRSAKRCKEKWENINKYFRKTKDLNKKRSVDSRTCPYYHQLSHLYSQGSLVGPTDRATNHPGSPENRSMAMSGQSQGNGSSNPPANNGATNTMQGNEANVVQVPGFDFEF